MPTPAALLARLAEQLDDYQRASTRPSSGVTFSIRCSGSFAEQFEPGPGQTRYRSETSQWPG